jgi:hypothetical protein
MLDVLGRSVLERVTDRLRSQGIPPVAVVGDAREARAAGMRHMPGWTSAAGAELWRTAQHAFLQQLHSGAELILLIRLGPYVEVDYQELIRFHVERNGRVTAVTDGGEEMLDIYAISTSHRNEAAYLLRNQLRAFRTPFVPYAFTGYANPLGSAADLRRLAVDAFCGRAQLAPAGEQVKPGVWVAPGARLQRGARILAPSFIGQHARIRAAAVITRCGAVEHHAEVQSGTVIEDSTILPETIVGAGLDLAHAVVGFGRVASLRRQVEVEIGDTKLIGAMRSAPVRALTQAAGLLTFLPWHFLRSIIGNRTPEPAALPDAVRAPAAALTAGESLPVTTGRES